MEDRIALDSDVVAKECMQENVEEMTRYIAEKSPSDVDVEDFIERLDETEFVAIDFYYFLPFLLDIFTSSPEKYRESIINMCHKLTKDVDQPKSEALKHLEQNRKRLVDLLVRSLEVVHVGKYRKFEVHMLLAGIAAAYEEQEIGVQIGRLCQD